MRVWCPLCCVWMPLLRCAGVLPGAVWCLLWTLPFSGVAGCSCCTPIGDARVPHPRCCPAQVEEELEGRWGACSVEGWEDRGEGAGPEEVGSSGLDLDAFDSVEELELLGADRLKEALQALGLKCGGTLRQRAERLMAIKGRDLSQVDKSLFAKGAKVGAASRVRRLLPALSACCVPGEGLLGRQTTLALGCGGMATQGLLLVARLTRPQPLAWRHAAVHSIPAAAAPPPAQLLRCWWCRLCWPTRAAVALAFIAGCARGEGLGGSAGHGS